MPLSICGFLFLFRLPLPPLVTITTHIKHLKDTARLPSSLVRGISCRHLKWE
ncbi:hypothetical protein BDE02_18G081400 [Populus trichocarpa]|nr:hypothetical protein BDE02_18G081400 [Populus trichocarpa]